MSQNEKNLDEWVQLEDEGSSVDFAGLAARYMVYWPLLFIMLSLGVAGAWTYIRYSPSIYGAASLVSIKSENPLGNSSTSISINFGANQNNALDKELMLMSSNGVFRQVVRKLHLYSELIGKGSVLSSTLYRENAPFSFKVLEPDSIRNPGTYPVEIDWKSNSVILDNRNYPFNTVVNSPFGLGVFEKNKSMEGDRFENLLLTVYTLDMKASQIRGKFTATPRGKTADLVDLVYFDVVQRRAIDVLDSLLPVYEALTLLEKRKSLLNSAEFIGDRLSYMEGELGEVERNISAFKSSNRVVSDITEQGSVYMSNVQASDKQIAELDLKLELLNKAQAYIQDRNARNSSLPAVIELGNSSISAQMTQLIAAEEEVNRLTQISGPENPKIIALRAQIERLKPTINESVNNYRSNLLNTRQVYQRQQSSFSGMLRTVPEKERELIGITRQMEIKNEIFKYLLQKREENVIAMASLVGNSQYIARPSGMGLISPKPLNLYSAFIGGAIAFFVIFILLRERINNSYQSRSEVEKGIRAPILGEVVENTAKKGEKLASIVVNPLRTNIIGEQFREIRTNLMYLGVGGENKILLVTSSMPGEGKTFVAINIAASLATTGKKVALLGFDLRKGKLGERSGVPVNPGICNYLVGQASLAKISYKIDDFATLDVLPEGLRPPNPAELMLNERMEKLMQELKFHYDFVVMDSPPIGSVTDARILAKYAYATLYVIRHQYTPRNYFALIKDVYQRKRLPNLAIVLNGIKKHSFMGYSYGNGHNAGYGYGYGYGYVGGSKNTGES